jgi:hypothetical protein
MRSWNGMTKTIAVCHRVYHKVTVVQRIGVDALPLDGTRVRLHYLEILRVSPMAHRSGQNAELIQRPPHRILIIAGPVVREQNKGYLILPRSAMIK